MTVINNIIWSYDYIVLRATYRVTDYLLWSTTMHAYVSSIPVHASYHDHMWDYDYSRHAICVWLWYDYMTNAIDCGIDGNDDDCNDYDGCWYDDMTILICRWWKGGGATRDWTRRLSSGAEWVRMIWAAYDYDNGAVARYVMGINVRWLYLIAVETNGDMIWWCYVE